MPKLCIEHDVQILMVDSVTNLVAMKQLIQMKTVIRVELPEHHMLSDITSSY
jgi:hypothetical protein